MGTTHRHGAFCARKCWAGRNLCVDAGLGGTEPHHQKEGLNPLLDLGVPSKLSGPQRRPLLMCRVCATEHSRSLQVNWLHKVTAETENHLDFGVL